MTIAKHWSGWRSCWVLSVALLACRSGNAITPAQVETQAPVGESIDIGGGEMAPFVRVIARPELYHGKRVQLIGYMNLEFEGNALYLSEELYRHGATHDALWIEVENMKVKPPYLRGWVLIEGKFNGERRGHFGMFAGTLEDITRLERWR